MSKPVIQVEHLSKRFVLRHQQKERYNSLRDTLAARVKSLWTPQSATTQEEFLALNDVSFSIEAGDRVGIIGRNGAGKSTLLKVLSRIVSPSSGRITIEGRMASLLEVGTGFHPELSGRENIYLNGSILGMTKAEINARFDEIVAFSEVERFLDTPVKRYSSGMYVRLAFAVAAHLEPEILVVDEVLAVGDAEFQKKCLGKMKDVSGQGRTVLFVSHNMGAINTLCNKTIVLQRGQVAFDGPVSDGVAYYLANGAEMTSRLAERTDRSGNGRFKFTDIQLRNKDNHVVQEVMTGESLNIELHFTNETMDLSKLLVSVAIMDDLQNIALAYVSDEMGTNFSFLESNGKMVLTIPSMPLRGGHYSIRLLAAYNGTSEDALCDLVENALRIQVISSDYWNSGIVIRDGQYAVAQGHYH